MFVLRGVDQRQKREKPPVKKNSMVQTDNAAVAATLTQVTCASAASYSAPTGNRSGNACDLCTVSRRETVVGAFGGISTQVMSMFRTGLLIANAGPSTAQQSANTIDVRNFSATTPPTTNAAATQR